MLNNTSLNSGEPLQISCSAAKLDNTSSLSYEIQVNGTTVARKNNSFVHIIKSVKSTEAGNYTCQVSLIDLPADNVGVSNKEMLSGKISFLIGAFHLCQIWKLFFFYFVVSNICMIETLTLNGLTHFSLVMHFI